MIKVKQRLLAKVTINTETGCWDWLASKSQGYGNIHIDGKMLSAHRVSYEVHRGKIPDGLYVCHRCDNRACINPEHLFLGTNAENTADRDAKGRQARGAANSQTKLSEADVLAIRASRDTQTICAKRFGVSQVQISNIRSGKCWGHLAPVGQECAEATE